MNISEWVRQQRALDPTFVYPPPPATGPEAERRREALRLLTRLAEEMGEYDDPPPEDEEWPLDRTCGDDEC